MDRDSEVETVLADDDWLDTSRRTPERSNQNCGRIAAASTTRRDGNGANNYDSFDEEELFSSSGSLSSLDEFSDSDTGGLNSDSTNQSGDGPIIRNGSTPAVRSSDAGRDADTQSAANSESEVDVDVDNDSEVYKSGGTRRGGLHRTSSGTRDESPSAWLVHRGRKVIADDDDDDDGMDDADTGGSMTRANEPSSKLKKRRRNKRKSHEELFSRMSPDDVVDKRESDAGGSNGKHTAVPESTPATVRTDDQTEDTQRKKHKQGKRRKIRYDFPDTADGRGVPQLVYFASRGDTLTCRKLLTRGASINISDPQGWTALHVVAKLCDSETLEMLLNPPIRITLPPSDSEPNSDVGQDAAARAVGGPVSEADRAPTRLMRQLHSPYPNVNAATIRSRTTPLHQAVAGDDIRAVRLLLEHGARTDIANSRQLTPLDTCTNEKIARLLTDTAKTQRGISIRDKAGQAKLHRACNAGDLEQVISLLNQGSDINMKDNAGWTPLHEAALEGHGPVVVALLRRGADYTAQGFGGDTPLHDACANGHVDVVRSLLTIGADPMLKNSKGVTPIDMAEDEDEVLELIDEFLRKQSRKRQAKRLVKPGKSDKGKRISRSSRQRASGIDSVRGRSVSAEVDVEVDIDGRDSPISAEVSRIDGKLLGKKRSRTSSPRPTKQREDQASSSRANGSSEVGKGGSAGAHKREIHALQRLREEAEKPQVNYYFSSANSTKMSRDERKLQALVGAFEKLEKKNQPRQKRRLSGELPNARQSRIRKDGGGSSMSPTKTDARQSKVSNAATGGDYEIDGVLVRNGATTSSKTSPKQRGTRPQKKRIIDDDDEEEWSDSDGTDDVTDSRMQKRQGRHTERNLPPVSKRPRHTAEHTSGSTSVVSTVEATGGSVIVTAADGTVQQRGSITPSNLFEPTHSTTSSPTVEIKREPLSASSTHQQPLSAGNRESTIRSPSRGGSNVRKEHRSKHSHTEGGRTIVEDADLQSSSPMTPSKIAAQAIRYLPLYTIQLPSEKSASMLDYYVVDLQIRLLLGMPVYTPSSTKAKTKVGADGKRPPECNPLFVAYPHLHRQQINGAQKERLWRPLADMFVSNMRYLHNTSDRQPLSGKPTTDGSSKDAADSEIVSQFTLHEKKRFISLSLSFVRLDEVVEIIKRDYPQVSKHLITLTLDIDSLASGTDSSVDTPATGDDLASAPPAGVKLRRMASLAQESKPKESCPVWNGPQKMLPLKYAMKLHYRNYTAFVDGKRA